MLPKLAENYDAASTSSASSSSQAATANTFTATLTYFSNNSNAKHENWSLSKERKTKQTPKHKIENKQQRGQTNASRNGAVGAAVKAKWQWPTD